MIEGHSLVGGRAVAGGATFRAIAAASHAELEPAFSETGADTVREACALAATAFDAFRELSPETRADFLDAVADAIAGTGDALIERAMQESGLPEARLRGERDRTTGQIRMFATLLREGDWLGAVIEPALPDRQPLPRPDLRQRRVPVGPVAVFGASNFPLAFSVAGGDTAAALAAGCPVVAKGHPAHPGTSEIVGRAILSAVASFGLPAGVFALLQGRSNDLGGALVRDPDIKAVGFTGSRGGGLALMALAAARPEPIPVFAEMSSINPVLLFPAALGARGGDVARGFVGSLTLGAGQFCTNPGLVCVVDGPDADRFEADVAEALSPIAGGTMLTPDICARYVDGIAARGNHAALRLVGQGADAGAACGRPVVFASDLAAFLADSALRDEVFGSTSLIVRCPDAAGFAEVLEAIEGQLTITLQIDAADEPLAAPLVPLLERRAGRILANGWPTGVEVSRAMVHGGPFPATSDGRSTSVGTAAIERFLRPVCYQALPDSLLPAALRSDNPLGLPRRNY